MPPRRATRTSTKVDTSATAATQASPPKRLRKGAAAPSVPSDPSDALASPKNGAHLQPADSVEQLFDASVEVLPAPIRVPGSSAGAGRPTAAGAVDQELLDEAAITEDEDLDAYESSFIDDSALEGEPVESDDEAAAGVDADDNEDNSRHEDQDGLNMDQDPQDNEDAQSWTALSDAGAQESVDYAAMVEMDDERYIGYDELPVPAPPVTPTKRTASVQGQNVGSPSKKIRFDLDQFAVEGSHHPLNPSSELHNVFYGATAYLAATNRDGDYYQWKKAGLLDFEPMLETEPWLLQHYSDLNYVLSLGLTKDYIAWMKDKMLADALDEDWMRTFTYLVKTKEAQAGGASKAAKDVLLNGYVMSNGVSSPSQSRTPGVATPAKMSTRGDSHLSASIATTPSKSSAKGKEPAVPRTPMRPAAATQAVNTPPETPRTAALITQMDNLTLVRKAALKYTTEVGKTQDDVALPLYNMNDVVPRTPLTIPVGDGVHAMDLTSDVLRSDTYNIDDGNVRGKVKLAMVACVDQYGPWLYNFGRIPLSMLHVDPPLNKDPRKAHDTMQLHRVIPNATQSHHLVAGVLFGVLPVESQLLSARLIPGLDNKYSKSISLLPLDVQFARTYSALCQLFRLDDLRVSVYKHGVTLRTRITTMGGTPGRNPSTRFKPLQVGTKVPANVEVMPPYLNKLQMSALEDDVPIYDARAYFTGDKVGRTFMFGVHDLQCPRMKRELKENEYAAVIHSVSTYKSGKNDCHGLALNVYYAVLLLSPSAN